MVCQKLLTIWLDLTYFYKLSIEISFLFGVARYNMLYDVANF